MISYETTRDMDPRWDWIEVTSWADPAPRYVKGRCKHLDVTPVESVRGDEILAYLCLTCDVQLPA